MTIAELQEQYIEDLKLDEASIEKRVIVLPKILSKYQNYYFKLLNKISEYNNIKDKTYYNIYMDYKMGNSELSNYTLSATELKKLLECSPVYIEVAKKLSELENELHLVESMMSNIKQIGWNIKNYIDYQKILTGNV